MKLKSEEKLSINNLDDGAEAYNDFYASVSVFLRIVSFVFFATFLIYIVYSAFVSADIFTYDNFDYVLRNYALTLSEKQDDSVYAIKYNPDSSRSYGMIGNKFTLVGNSGISVYSSTGRLTCSDSFSFKNPIMSTSDKYALIYDSGSNELIIYNSFSKVHSQLFDKPIRRACMAQNGYFAVVTSSDEYNSTVEVYNDNFKLINRFNKSGYVLDADITEERILVATAKPSVGYDAFEIQILIYDFASQDISCDTEVTASLPLSCKISTSGFYLVCSDEAITYELSSGKSTIFSYNGSSVSDLYLTRDYAALLLKTRGYDISYRLVTIDNDAKIIYDYTVDSTVYDVVLCGSSACLLTEAKINIFDTDTKSSILIDGLTSGCQLLSYDEGTLYLCTESSAPLIDIRE